MNIWTQSILILYHVTLTISSWYYHFISQHRYSDLNATTWISFQYWFWTLTWLFWIVYIDSPKSTTKLTNLQLRPKPAESCKARVYVRLVVRPFSHDNSQARLIWIRINIYHKRYQFNSHTDMTHRYNISSQQRQRSSSMLKCHSKQHLPHPLLHSSCITGCVTGFACFLKSESCYFYCHLCFWLNSKTQ